MRSKFVRCAAIAVVGLASWFASYAQAAQGRDAKDAKKKPAELHADEKAMKKQTQWEDKVMGPDDKRSELDRIARARALNEKAEKERERQAALEAAAPAPKAAPTSNAKTNKSEVNLLSDSDDSAKGDRHAREISPKLETEAARAPAAPVKRADDKFIDKLLKDEDSPTGGNGTKRASASNDKDLASLLAGAKEPKSGRKKGDSIDDLLKSADKGPAMPAPRVQSQGLPDWAKQPEIRSTPNEAPPAAVAVRTAPPGVGSKRKDDGVIHVVQGAAGNAPAIVAPSGPVAARSGRKGKASAQQAQQAQQIVWNDPFAEKKPAPGGLKKEPASRPTASANSGWNDPFAAEPSETRKPVRRGVTTPSAPAASPKRRDGEKAEPSARPATWKDPFTKATVPVPPQHAPVAMRELGKGESSKWEIAARRPATRAATASDSHSAGGWGVIKKRSR